MELSSDSTNKYKLNHGIELQVGGSFLVYGINYRIQSFKNKHYFASGTGFSYIPYTGFFANQYGVFGYKLNERFSIELGLGYTIVYDYNGKPSSKEARNEFYSITNGIYHAPYYAKFYDIVYSTIGITYRLKKIDLALNFQPLYSYLYYIEKRIWPYASFIVRFKF
jgi:hypothetical protein